MNEPCRTAHPFKPTYFAKPVGKVSAVGGRRFIHIVFIFNLGHTRYCTAGVSEITNCQPFVVETLHGLISLGHNGELVNANPLKQTVIIN